MIEDMTRSACVRPRVVLAHPTRQHAHHLACGLDQAKLLQRMYTMLPGSEFLEVLPDPLKSLLPSAIRRWSPLGLPPYRIRARPLPLAIMKAAHLFRSFHLDGLIDLWTWQVFDKWVAKCLMVERPDIVVGYEMCCAETFMVAKRMGILCVLDSAAVHYSLQDRVLPEASASMSSWWGRQTRRRKERELQLADRIICVSEFAADSYRQAGVPLEKISVRPLGCDVRQFAPAQKSSDATARFCFVGAPGNVKGTSLLLTAFNRLINEGYACELHFFGEARALTLAAAREAPKNVFVHGKLSHKELARQLPVMDCLALPSLVDSFGMVVLEALASGTYVIVSDMVGAQSVVTPGQSGEVVQANNLDALYVAMRNVARNLPAIRNRSQVCRDNAMRYDWSRYQQNAVEYFRLLKRG